MSELVPSGAEAIFLGVALVATVPLVLALRRILKELRRESAPPGNP